MNNIFYKIKESVTSVWSKFWFYTKFSNAGWRWPYYDLKYGIQNLIGFFKLIWTWRFWDYSYFLRVVIYMLKRMEKGLKEEDGYVNVDKDTHDIKVARILLERVLEDDYHDMVYKDYYRKWGQPEFSTSPVDFDDEGDVTFYQLDITHENADTEKLEEQRRKEYRRLLGRPDELRQRDLEYAMRIIGKYLLNWWS